MESKTHRATLTNPVVRSGAPLPMLPTGDRVAVERLDPDEEVVAGIIIPGVDKEKNLYATIVAAGLLALDVLHDHNIGIGDTVCIGRYSGVVWDFRPKGAMRNERVDIVNVKDIYGSVEMVDKVMSGEIEIALKTENDGQRRHRYWKLEETVTDEPTAPERPSNHVPKEVA
jgi:co-chaperonin GroES (HSP10)